MIPLCFGATAPFEGAGGPKSDALASMGFVPQLEPTAPDRRVWCSATALVSRGGELASDLAPRAFDRLEVSGGAGEPAAEARVGQWPADRRAWRRARSPIHHAGGRGAAARCDARAARRQPGAGAGSARCWDAARRGGRVPASCPAAEAHPAPGRAARAPAGRGGRGRVWEGFHQGERLNSMEHADWAPSSRFFFPADREKYRRFW